MVAPSSTSEFRSSLVLFMLRSRFASHAVALIGLILGPSLAAADSGTPVARGIDLAIEDFTYLDTSGELADQVAAHKKRLQALNTAFRQDFAADRQYHLIPVSCGPRCVDDGSVPAALLRAVSGAGAKILVIGAVHKLSTLVQNAKVVAIDIEAKRVVLERLFTFRGDNDEAWQRAEAFMSREVREILAEHWPPRDETTKRGGGP
jgi:uncharacterized protein DUF2380